MGRLLTTLLFAADDVAPAVTLPATAWLERHLPEVLLTPKVQGLMPWQWLGLAVALLGGWSLGRLIARLVIAVAHRVARRSKVHWDDELVTGLEGPAAALVPLLIIRALLVPLALPANSLQAVSLLMTLLLIAVATWAASRAVSFAGVLVLRQAERHMHDLPAVEREQRLRGVKTQTSVLERVLGIVVVVLGVALMLMQFQVVRNVGLSLLASAGIAGVVLGLAAQRSFASLVAGLQLSMTQPVRIGDTVVVDGEYGWVEEINLTYMVVRLWDERRMVTPISRFLDNTFFSLTRSGANLLGTVVFHADYALPIDAVRTELDRLLEANPKWDKQAKAVHVVEAEARTMQIRLLVSATVSDLFQLRADVREGMIAWLRQYEGGRFLPRVRVEEGPVGAGGPAAASATH